MNAEARDGQRLGDRVHGDLVELVHDDDRSARERDELERGAQQRGGLTRLQTLLLPDSAIDRIETREANFSGSAPPVSAHNAKSDPEQVRAERARSIEPRPIAIEHQ